MTSAFKVFTSISFLLVVTICISAEDFARSTSIAPPQTSNSKGLSIQPFGSFPPEPLLPGPSAEIDSLLKQADALGRQGDFYGAIRTYEEALARTFGPSGRPIDKAFVLSEKTRALLSLQKYSEASAAARDAAATFENEQDAPDQVDVLVRVAAYLLAFGVNRAEADDMLERALKIGQTETLRPGKMSQRLRDAGANDLRSHGTGWSKKFSLAAFEIARKFADGSEELGYISYDLALLAFESGEFTEAEVQFRQNIELWNELSDKQSAQLAKLNRQLQEVDQKDLFSVQSYRNLVQAAANHLAYFRGRVAGCQMRLAEIAQRQGNSRLAHEWLDEASRTQKNGNSDVRFAAEVSLLKAALEMDEGELSTAGNDLFSALELTNKSGDQVTMVRCESELGRLALLQFNYSSAETYLQVAQAGIEARGNAAIPLADNRKSLGQAYAVWGWTPQDLTNQKLAQRNLALALSIYEQYEMPFEIAEVKLIRGSFGVNASPDADAKDLAEANAILRRLAPQSVMMARLLISLAYNDDKKGNHEAASPNLLVAREILSRNAPKSMALAVIEHNLMVYAREKGQMVEAEKLALESWQLVRRIADEFAGEDAGESYSSTFANYGASLAYVQMSLKKNEAALLTLELTRARGLFQLLSQRKKLSENQWLDHQKALSAKYAAESHFYKALIARDVVGKSLDALVGVRNSPEAQAAQANLRERDEDVLATETRLALATARADALWRDIMEKSPVEVASDDLSKLQKGLPAGTVFLLFARDRNNLLVFALRGGRPEIETAIIDIDAIVFEASRFKPGDPPKQLGDVVVDFRNDLNKEPWGNVDPLATKGEVIFNTLFPGRLRSTVLKAERLVISPESVLWTLPFAALVTGRKPNQEPEYLGLLKPITYTQSLSLYLAANNDNTFLKPKQKPVALVVGDPLFDLRGTPGFVSEKRENASSGPEHTTDTAWASLANRVAPPRQLPDSLSEAESIACLFHATPLLGIDAKEERVRQEIERADVIHLATHAVIDDVPMSSGILLSPPPKDPAVGETMNDGALQAWEIFSQLRLRADLAVLSACNTALGKNVRGEGIVGLTRALQYAGARSVVASQWEVEDPSTSMLMRAFYNALNEGKSKDEALRQAMLKVSTDKTTSHPHYWAAFTLTGGSTNSSLGGVSKTPCN